MRMISHFHRRIGGVGGAKVAFRYYTLECELAAMKGLRILQVAVTLEGEAGELNTESVDPELVALLEERRDEVGVRELLDRLAGRYDGRPIGELAVTAANLLPDGE